MPGFEAVFGKLDREYRDETQHRIRVFRDAIAGKPVEFRSPELIKNEPPEFFVRPRAPELGDRLWYGAGSIPSAQTTAKIGLDLLQSTLNINPTADTFEKTQRNNIEAYLEAWELPRRPRVCVSLLFMPAVNQRQRELYAAFDAIRQAEGPAGPRPRGAQEPGTFQPGLPGTEADQLRNVQLCPIYHGDPDYVLERAQGRRRRSVRRRADDLASAELHPVREQGAARQHRRVHRPGARLAPGRRGRERP